MDLINFMFVVEGFVFVGDIVFVWEKVDWVMNLFIFILRVFYIYFLNVYFVFGDYE